MAYRNIGNRPAGPGGGGQGGGGSRKSSFDNPSDSQDSNPNPNDIDSNSKEPSPPVRNRERSSTIISVGTLPSVGAPTMQMQMPGSLPYCPPNLNANAMLPLPVLPSASGNGNGNGGSASGVGPHSVGPVYYRRDMISGPGAGSHQAAGNNNRQPSLHSRRASQQQFQHRPQAAFPQLQHQHPHQHPLPQRSSPPKYPHWNQPTQRSRLHSQSISSSSWQNQPYHHQLQQISSASASIPPHGSSSSISPPTQPIPLPEISDATSLVRAVQLDPAQTFQLVKNIKEERDRLRAENRNVVEAMQSMRDDFRSQRVLHERLAGIWRQKELLLWDFVERIKLEKAGGGRAVKRDGDIAGGGEWIPGDDEEEDVRGRARSRTIRQLKTEDEHDVVSARTRSRTIGQSTRDDEHDVLSLTEGSTMSGGESMDASLMLRLDPSATPFIPSPAKSTKTQSQRGGAESAVSQSDAIPVHNSNTPVVKPAIPLSFRDVLKLATSPTRTPTREARKVEVPQPQATKQGSSSNTSKHGDKDSARGGKKSNKNRGGKSSAYGSMHRKDTATTSTATKLFDSETGSHSSKDDSFVYLPQRKNRGTENPSPSRSLSPIKKPWSQVASKRRVSPEVVRVANLPAYPLPFEPQPPSTRKQPPTFLSRARMNATLELIPKPFDGICPFSLLSSKEECHVKGCNLLHVCDVFNSTNQEQEFPPLESSVPGSSVVTVQMRCRDENGNGVRQGEVCNRGIHVHRSCAEEIEGESCSFWSKKNSPEKGKSKKYQPLDLERNFISPIAAGGSEGDQTHGHPTPSTPIKDNKGGEDRDQHFKLYVHERDGAGRVVWDARVLNAGLRDTHACGLWGVDIGFGVTGEDEEAVERARSIEWKGRGLASSVEDSKVKGKGRAKDPSEVDEGERQWGVKWEEKKRVITREEWAARGEWSAKK